MRDILDVGCGRGRVLVPLAREGFRLAGIDLSPVMLSECRRRLDRDGAEAVLRQADFEALADREQYDAVLGMDSVICYVLETPRLLEMLRRFHCALRPGGVLVLDNWNMLAQWAILDRTTPFVMDAGGIRVDYRERNRFDSLHSLFHLELEGDVLEAGRTSRFRHEEVLRVTTVEEMEGYLAQAGFDAIAVHPDYRFGAREPVNPESICYTARRPGGDTG